MLMFYFRFPTNNENLKQQWIQAIKKKNWQQSTASRICNNHFKESDFINDINIKRKL